MNSRTFTKLSCYFGRERVVVNRWQSMFVMVELISTSPVWNSKRETQALLAVAKNAVFE